MSSNYELRSSVTRTNARFRGPTESDKYTNFVGEAVHDLTLLGKVIDRDDFIFSTERGQSDFIHDNLSIYFNGNNKEITANIGTSVKMVKVLGPVFENTDLTDWTVVGCSVAKIEENTFKITPTGVPAVALRRTIGVTEGEVIRISMYVKVNSFTENHLGYVGSSDIYQGQGSLSSYESKDSFLFVEHYLQCKQKETISIEILGNRGNGEFEIAHPKVEYMEINELKLEPTNTAMKRRINTLEDEINHIINNL